METRPPLPPFTEATATLKVRAAEDAWNSRDPDRVVGVYTDDTEWRNRVEFPRGREQVREFLQRKWARELDYRLIKELWACGNQRIAVRFAYEWHDDSGQWFRSYGNENWAFTPEGLMQRRYASINDIPIAAKDRLFFWRQGLSMAHQGWSWGCSASRGRYAAPGDKHREFQREKFAGSRQSVARGRHDGDSMRDALSSPSRGRPVCCNREPLSPFEPVPPYAFYRRAHNSRSSAMRRPSPALLRACWSAARCRPGTAMASIPWPVPATAAGRSESAPGMPRRRQAGRWSLRAS